MPNTFNPDSYGGNVQSAVSAARAANGAVVLSPGVTYSVSTPVKLDWQGASIGCEVKGAKATLNASVGNINVIELQGGTGFIEQLGVHDLIIGRTTTAASGAAGIKQVGGILGRSHIADVEVKGHFYGVMLDGTDFSTVENLDVHHNASHGVYLYASSYIPLQWYFAGQNISQFNGGSGLVVAMNPAVSQPGGFSVATITNFATFANGGYGMAYIGTPQCPLQSVRVMNCFLGDDAADELFLDTYGNDHRVSQVYIELGKARGIYITPNNKRVSLNDCFVNGCNLMGIALCSDDSQCNNCTTTSNGRGGSAKWGIYVEGSRNLVNGGHNGNGPSGTVQEYGVVFANANSHAMIGVNNTGNTLAPVSNPPTRVAANIP